MKIIVIDNYDSFTYNLIHYIKELTTDTIDVFRNDEISVEKVGEYDKILLSPGPGIPSEAGIMPEVIKKYGATKCILGVCLGHQAIVEAYGGEIYNMPQVYHGVESNLEIISHDEIYTDFPKTFLAGRYHSWNAVKKSLPDCFEITAVDELGEVMSVKHKTHNVRGVQYHPESVLTPEGKKLIKNWLLI
jgi:anthranilate synthase component II